MSCRVVTFPLPELSFRQIGFALNYLRSAYGLLCVFVLLGERIPRPWIRDERLQHRPGERVFAGIHPCLPLLAATDGDAGAEVWLSEYRRERVS